MAGEDTESTAVLTTPEVQPEATVETEAAQWLHAIVHSDDPESDDELQPDAQVAPDAGHPTEPKAPDAPASGTPTADAGADGTVTDPTTDAESATPQGDDAAKAEPANEDDALFNELLGVKETEPDDSPVWKERHSEATRALHEARDQMKHVAEILRQQGREIVTTKDGFGIAPTADAKDFDPASIDLNAVVKGLSPEDLDRIADNPAEGAMVIAKSLAKEFATRVPPITARPQDAILSPQENQATWNEFTGAKLSNGKPLYPNATDTDVMADMERAYGALAPELQERAERDVVVLRAAMENAYFKVQRARQVKVAMAKHRAAKVAEQNQKNKQGVAVTGSGSETTAKAQSTTGAPEQGSADWWRNAIVNAGNDVQAEG